MIGAAPTVAAPCTAFNPTPPVPMITTHSPGRTPAVLVTAPKPVSTPQAISEAASSGTSFGMATAWEPSTTTYSANAPVRMPCTSASPFAVSGLRSSSGNTASHNTCAPVEQDGQCPQDRISVTTTWSPTATWVTPAPTSSTMPAASWPYTAGSVPPQPPSA